MPVYNNYQKNTKKHCQMLYLMADPLQTIVAIPDFKTLQWCVAKHEEFV